jgi:hypothetical protein
MTDEEQQAKEQFKLVAEETGTCTAFKVFSLGANGTVYVGCGIEATEPHGFHMAQQGKPEGDLVIFRWPVE